VASDYNIDIESAMTIVEIFDRDCDGELNYAEFAKSLSPKDTSYTIKHMRSQGKEKINQQWY
jgi:Ca2+-binding EF-hand superfamily protein